MVIGDWVVEYAREATVEVFQELVKRPFADQSKDPITNH